MGKVIPYDGINPVFGKNVFLADTSVVVGNVKMDDEVSIWFNTVVRGDVAPITIGKYTNIQDNTTIHGMTGSSTTIGNYVTIGHNAVLHCYSLGDNCLVGMGAVLLGYTEIGHDCIIGAGTLVTQNHKIPAYSLVYGNPARIIRRLREDEIDALHKSAERYNLIAKKYMK